jgi:hypothetical protein
MIGPGHGRRSLLATVLLATVLLATVEPGREEGNLIIHFKGSGQLGVTSQSKISNNTLTA